jgi:RNA polymerase sigma-70 factor (ECF subfamily)
MAQLPDSERTTLILHYFEGYKVEEIAQITNSTDAAVKKRLQRGREELKRRIKL